MCTKNKQRCVNDEASECSSDKRKMQIQRSSCEGTGAPSAKPTRKMKKYQYRVWEELQVIERNVVKTACAC